MNSKWVYITLFTTSPLVCGTTFSKISSQPQGHHHQLSANNNFSSGSSPQNSLQTQTIKQENLAAHNGSEDELIHKIETFKESDITKIYATLLLKKEAQKKLEELYPREEERNYLLSLIAVAHLYDATYHIKHQSKSYNANVAKTTQFGDVLHLVYAHQADLNLIKQQCCALKETSA
jgi:secreted trypsin-like serine protease